MPAAQHSHIYFRFSNTFPEHLWKLSTVSFTVNKPQDFFSTLHYAPSIKILILGKNLSIIQVHLGYFHEGVQDERKCLPSLISSSLNTGFGYLFATYLLVVVHIGDICAISHLKGVCGMLFPFYVVHTVRLVVVSTQEQSRL